MFAFYMVRKSEMNPQSSILTEIVSWGSKNIFSFFLQCTLAHPFFFRFFFCFFFEFFFSKFFFQNFFFGFFFCLILPKNDRKSKNKHFSYCNPIPIPSPLRVILVTSLADRGLTIVERRSWLPLAGGKLMERSRNFFDAVL